MFQLDPELESFREDARKMAERAFAAKAAYWDEEEIYPTENLKLLAELGYLGLVIPEEYGGSGAPIIQGTILLEEIARVCFNTALVAQGGINGPSRAITILANEEQKKRWLPGCVSGENIFGIGISEPGAGSAMTDMITSATPDGDHIILNGQKCFHTTPAHLRTRMADLEAWRALFHHQRADGRRPKFHAQLQAPDEFLRPRARRQCGDVSGCGPGRLRTGAQLFAGAQAVRQADL